MGFGLACSSAFQPLFSHASGVVFRDMVLCCRVSAPAGPLSHRGILGLPAPWFVHFQDIELSLSGPRAALGRSHAQVRDAGRVLSGLVSRFRQALLDGSSWLALLPWRGKFRGGYRCSCRFQSEMVCSSRLSLAGPAQVSLRCSMSCCTTVQGSILLCPACPVARLLFQKWSSHQVVSCLRVRS